MSRALAYSRAIQDLDEGLVPLIYVADETNTLEYVTWEPAEIELFTDPDPEMRAVTIISLMLQIRQMPDSEGPQG